jgi:hypothetical protein
MSVGWNFQHGYCTLIMRGPAVTGASPALVAAADKAHPGRIRKDPGDREPNAHFYLTYTDGGQIREAIDLTRDLLAPHQVQVRTRRSAR